MAVEASRIALKYMTPVMYLSDAFIGNGAEPWRVPTVDELPDISVPNAKVRLHRARLALRKLVHEQDRAEQADRERAPGGPEGPGRSD